MAELTGCAYLTQQDLEDLMGPDMVVRFFCDDGSGTPSPAMMGRFGKRAEAAAASRLLRAWTADQITELMVGDDDLRAHVAWMCMHFGSERKEAFQAEDGGGAYPSQYKRACEQLDLLSKARRQSLGEATAGLNDQIGAGAVLPRVETGDVRFKFAPTKDSGTRGGIF